MAVCTGPELMRSLGLEVKDLIPVSSTMIGAGQNRLDVLGGMFCEITVWDKDRDRTCRSYQMVYVIRTMSQTYLSYSSLVDFETIDAERPSIAKRSRLNKSSNANIIANKTDDTLQDISVTGIAGHLPPLDIDIENILREGAILGQCDTHTEEVGMYNCYVVKCICTILLPLNTFLPITDF